MRPPHSPALPRRWHRRLVAGALVVAAGAAAIGLVAAERNPVARPPAVGHATAEAARVIVQYRPGTSLLRAQAAGAEGGERPVLGLAARQGLALREGRALADRMQVLLADGLDSASLAARLAADPAVEWAVVDGRRHRLAAPDDPLYPTPPAGGATPVSGQWYLRPNAGAVRASIDVEPAWVQSTGAGVVVAVLDTGITAHPDLAAQVLPGYDFIGYGASGNAAELERIQIANDGDLEDANPADPGDWITEDENDSGTFDGCEAGASSWHGTQVAGLAAAQTGNATGMAGVARDARVLPVRVLGKCGGYDSDIIAAMRWAAGFTVGGVAANANPAQVLNLSLGSQGSCSAAYRSVVAELTAAHVVVVAAAGNDGLAVGTPANCPGVVAVAGLRHVGTKVGYSDLGPEVVVSAPGGNCVNETGACLYPLLSASNTGSQGPGAATYTTSYDVTLGTSFASPLVAGTVALMRAANPALTTAQATSALKSSARTFPTTGGDSGSPTCQAPGGATQDGECYCTTSTCGAGMLDASGAVARALSGPFPVLDASATAPLAGTSVTLSATGSSALAGRSIAGHRWRLTQGAGLASFTGPTDAATTTLLVTGAGVVEIELTTTDSAGASAVLRQRLEVAASGLVAAIAATPAAPRAGQTVLLDGSGSTAGNGRSIAGYAWAITAGGERAGFSGATDGVTASLLTTSAGTVTVQLTVTDSAGAQASTSQTLTISAAPGDDDDGGGGGGGGLGLAWGLGLLLAAAALRRPGRG